jgi:glucosamine--fructose-6-phosphate aminotransferase (isomerizing)
MAASDPAPSGSRVAPPSGTANEDTGQKGKVFLGEIREQPDALLRLLDELEPLERAARALARRPRPLVRMIGHGSSDNASSYGVYTFGILGGLTAIRDSISLSVYYDADIDFSDSVVLGLSQSGRTPDVVRYVERARARGAATIALTNDSESDLAEASEHVVPLAAGPERAVAATKTYMNELASLALLAAFAAGDSPRLTADVRSLAETLRQSIPSLEQAAAAIAASFVFVGRMFLIGRGPEFATAREIALKLVETCRLAAEPFTATALTHGPVAALDPLFPVWAIATDDESLETVVAAARRVRQAGAMLVGSGNAAARLRGAAYRLPAPPAPRPLLAPLLSVVPGQLFVHALALAKGLDPDRPTGLTKVTLAP